MNEKQDTNSKEKKWTTHPADDELRDERKSGIGMGKKVGLYGCGFMLLMALIFILVLIFIDPYIPFIGTEEVGP